MNSLIDVNNEENKKAKGVSKKVVKNKIHKEHVDVLFNKKRMGDKMKRIQSKYLVLMTQVIAR